MHYPTVFVKVLVVIGFLINSLKKAKRSKDKLLIPNGVIKIEITEIPYSFLDQNMHEYYKIDR